MTSDEYMWRLKFTLYVGVPVAIIGVILFFLGYFGVLEAHN